MTTEQLKKYNAEPIKNNKGDITGYAFSPISNGVKYFIDNYGADLLKAINNSGIFFATAAAQKMYESGFGNSTFATKYNNFGGITYGSGIKGSSGKIGKFAIFNSPYDCFYTYVNNVLKDPTKKYLPNGLLAAKTPIEQIMVIAKSGYCESPPDPNAYAKPIIKLINLVTNMYPTFGKVNG
jgi:uncharacterized FlgJ-related protein